MSYRFAVINVAFLVAFTPGIYGQEPSAEDYTAMRLDYFVGEWEMSVSVGHNTPLVGTWTCQASASKRCLICSSTLDGAPSMNSLAGYDPEVKGWREVAFQADGGNATIVYRQSLDGLRGDPVGKVVRGTLKEITKDGKQGNAEVNLMLTARDRWEGRIVGRSRDGETLPDIRAVFERKKN